ncbi:mucin-5AC-like isoform X2 [Cynoglossus semilaevis]|uniref:mucin-5AC-like isoform X2 n=1 Tax=Cynoglossus semilaevis TaxID=244447 RepID=UPI000D62F322|nr:mucin-5AC-like isoform X2 [Cynoglossus semilaevis]
MTVCVCACGAKETTVAKVESSFRPVLSKPSAVCWTQWFNRDDPSGSGDWETLADLCREYPGEVCHNPLQIQIKTVSGGSMDSTGDRIHAADTTTGLVCKNTEQERGLCSDYMVRFQCPDSFCIDREFTCWTTWFNRDDPSGLGDWETVTDLCRENPGQICQDPIEIQVKTTSGASMDSTGDVIFVANTNSGFVCRNADQESGTCEDYTVRFKCPISFCVNNDAICWTPWFNRDDPNGSGDWETLTELKKQNLGKICDSPLQIEVQTTSGDSMDSTGDTIDVADVHTGFVCKNSEQTSGKCQDYEVRFQCPNSYCITTESTCWTNWFNRDDPSGTGDWETFEELSDENRGKICSSPFEIQVQTTSGLSVASTGDTIYAANARIGFVCKNSDQTSGKCQDYTVRFRCPDSFCPDTGPNCWTHWFDRDDPSGNGDSEMLADLRREHPGQICDSPLQIQVKTTSGDSMESTGDRIDVADATSGFACENADQDSGKCQDYTVRFQCPNSFCTTASSNCWSKWFDRDDPGGTGDWETLTELCKEKPGEICTNPLSIQVKTVSGNSMESTGDTIDVADKTTGFVCKNSDQTSGICQDYTVRFQCPDSFCNDRDSKCWTRWFDRDDPSGNGDSEMLADLRREHPGQICDSPLHIQVKTTSGDSMETTGEKIEVADTTSGFMCENADQDGGICQDYTVRFQCPESFCSQPSSNCWSKWFDRDDPGGTGDWETLTELRKEKPGEICTNPLGIQVKTVSGNSMESTGDTIDV